MVLAAVQDLDEHILVVRTPAYVGEVAFLGEIVYLGVDGASCGQVVDAQGDEFRSHPVHGVLYVLELSRTGVYVQEGEVRDTALILAVEGQFLLVWRPEDASVNTELVSADALSVGNLVILAYGNNMFYTVFTRIEQALGAGVGLVLRRRGQFHLGDAVAVALR